MVQLAIRCHPFAPVAAGELEGWLERLVQNLHPDAGPGTVRLSRLTQGGPNADLDAGWLIELEVPEHDAVFADERLAEILTDMRLLGLQPTLLTPNRAWTNGRAA